MSLPWNPLAIAKWRSRATSLLYGLRQMETGADQCRQAETPLGGYVGHQLDQISLHLHLRRHSSPARSATMRCTSTFST